MHSITIEPVVGSDNACALVNHNLQCSVYIAGSRTEAIQVLEEYERGERPEFEEFEPKACTKMHVVPI